MAPSPKSEILALEAAFRAAQARLGIATAYLTGESWVDRIHPTSPAKGAGAWLNEAAQAVAVVRRRSAKLSRMYYQYSRALQVGTLLGNPDEIPLRLSAVRKAFTHELELVAQVGLGSTGLTGANDEWFDDLLAEKLNTDNTRASNFLANDLQPKLDDLMASATTPDKALTADRFTWPEDMSDEKLWGVVTDYLNEHSIKALEAKVKESEKVENETSKQLRQQKDHVKSGSMGAGYADHFAISAGRSLISYVSRRDKRVMLVARGTSGNPCYWCAMLASRGFVYRSESSAGFNDQGVSSWHPNCHCYPIVRFTTPKAGEFPESTEYFSKLWDSEISGKYSGQEAVRAWRRLLTARAAEDKQRLRSQEGRDGRTHARRHYRQ